MGRKTTLWVFQTTNKQHLTWENLDMAKKSKLKGQCDPLRDVQEIEIWPYEQMVYAQPRICPRKWHT